jgi:uncharacterized protein (DUF1501 family)
MNRRSFLARSTGAVALPFLVNGLPVHAFDGPLLADLFNLAEESDRVLVLVQLNGGNDGINTVLPIDQEDAYNAVRSNIAIPMTSALKLNNSLGLHPAMTDLHRAFGEQKVAVLNGVGYPNPNQSHFRSTDIWMSGSSSNQVVSSGWIGRYLDGVYPGYPDGYPSAAMPDPIAIQMSAVVSLALTGGQQQSMGMALQDPETFYDLVQGTTSGGGSLPSHAEARANVAFIRDVQGKAQVYSTVIKQAASKAENKADYGDVRVNRLAAQMQIVARLIAGGLKTRVYVVSLGGFDTHASQVLEGEPTNGTHAILLGYVSAAMAAFQKDLEAHGVQDRVITMTFSEFGRRVASNLSFGTDHGTSAPMFIMGSRVIDGIRTPYPSLTDLEQGDLKMTVDFRQIYASVLEQWFGAKPEVIRQILFQDFATVPIIKAGSSTGVSRWDGVVDGLTLYHVTPNPVRDAAAVRYRVDTETVVRVDVFDPLGFHVATLANGQHTPGEYSAPFSTTTLPSGTYHVRCSAGRRQATTPVVVVR